MGDYCSIAGPVIPIHKYPAQWGLANTSSKEFQHIPSRKHMPAPCCADARPPLEPQRGVNHKEVSNDRIALVGMGAVG
eukprot:189037-Pyramimonas_sp.AAC.1